MHQEKLDPKWAMSIKSTSVDTVTVRGSRQLRNKRKFQVVVDDNLCKGCYYCVRFCPMGVFIRSDSVGPLGYNVAKVEFPENCNGCKACLLYCPDFAVAIQEEREGEEQT